MEQIAVEEQKQRTKGRMLLQKTGMGLITGTLVPSPLALQERFCWVQIYAGSLKRV